MKERKEVSIRGTGKKDERRRKKEKSERGRRRKERRRRRRGEDGYLVAMDVSAEVARIP